MNSRRSARWRQAENLSGLWWWLTCGITAVSVAMDKRNGHFERGHIRGSGRSPRGHDGRPERRTGQSVACDADPGWLAVEAA
jgi:hypothetical protein